jgi:hypothetical protein
LTDDHDGRGTAVIFLSRRLIFCIQQLSNRQPTQNPLYLKECILDKEKTFMMKWKAVMLSLNLILTLAGCASSSQAQTAEIKTMLSTTAIKTLQSLHLVNDHPLYTMTYYGDYDTSSQITRLPVIEPGDPQPRSWACSLFAALADPDNFLFGRNFDWDPSPALLLFTHPVDGYASVSVVDIAYLGFTGAGAQDLDARSLSEVEDLLDAPFLPFDGMNETGLAIGMAAVPPGDMQVDPVKPTIDSLLAIRMILDHAASVDEAIGILRSYNIDMGGGPDVHYLIADAAGAAVLVEFINGEMIVTRNDQPWHLATNFLVAAAPGEPEGQCWRYDLIARTLKNNNGILTPEGALELLNAVAQPNTQWSIVYEMSSQQVSIVMDGMYDTVDSFSFSALEETR